MKITPTEDVIYNGRRYLANVEYDVPADFPNGIEEAPDLEIFDDNEED